MRNTFVILMELGQLYSSNSTVGDSSFVVSGKVGLFKGKRQI